jgi:3-hydroxyacyl-CoA dehydrogenase
MGNVNSVTDLNIEQGVAVIVVNSPPVNALSSAVREGLFLAFKQALADNSATAVVLTCDGRTFFAGADISEFGQPARAQGASFADVLNSIEAATKPVVAAIFGTALGGGLETALTCHYRVAVPSARLGLPEVHLGLLPGAGGTQRLPRIVGVEAALDIMTSGRQVKADDALKVGLIDEIVEEGKLREQAIAFAKKLVAEKRPLKRVRDLDDKLAAARGKPEIFAEFRKKNARAFKGFKAPENIIKAVEAAVALPFDQGIKREQELFGELIMSTESAAQRHVFFAERETAKIPDVPSSTPTLPIANVGILGAGTMGGGIAMNFLNVGIPVTIVEIKQEALDRGVKTIRSNYERSVKSGRMTMADVEKRMGLLKPSLDMNAFAQCDLVIEAVFERLDIKKDVFTKLDGIVKQGAILASNTSFLDLDAIAAVTKRPEFVVGLHFFSPANVMRLLEVVRGAKTSKEVINTAMQLGRKIGKVAVLSKVCNGFIANRIMAQRGVMQSEIILQGVSPWDVDRVFEDYGFPMGPFKVTDVVGLDVIGWDRENTASRTVQEVLCEMDRWGVKKGAGYYDYDADRKPSPSPVVEKIIADFRAKKGVKQRTFTDQEILETLLFPVVNEGAKVLEEGIAIRASDIDMACLLGYGWPVYRGGPMFWANQVGLQKIVDWLKNMQAERGDQFKPSALLVKLASEGKTF